MALNSQGLQSGLSEVSVTFVCNEGTSSSTGTFLVWCLLHSMGILLPSVHQLDSGSSGGQKVCPELCACRLGSNFLAPGQQDLKALGCQQIVKQCLTQQV